MYIDKSPNMQVDQYVSVVSGANATTDVCKGNYREVILGSEAWEEYSSGLSKILCLVYGRKGRLGFMANMLVSFSE